jgi:hypothetical protein
MRSGAPVDLAQYHAIIDNDSAAAGSSRLFVHVDFGRDETVGDSGAQSLGTHRLPEGQVLVTGWSLPS